MAHPRPTRLLLLIVFLLWLGSALLLQLSLVPRFAACTSEALFDARIDYDAHSALAIMHAYGPCGRELYRAIQLADLVMPVCFGLLLVGICLRSLHRAGVRRWAWGLLPLALVLFDLAENLGIYLMLNGFPQKPGSSLVDATRLMTLLKFGSYGLAILGTLLCVALARRRRPALSAPASLLLVLPFVVLPPALSFADDAAPPRALALRIAEAPLIDGKLDDACWQSAPFHDQFRQTYPNDQAPPSYPTAFAVAFDDDALYIAIRATDQPSLISAPLARRDASVSTDSVSVAIGSLADRRTAFEFSVNPAGVVFDGLRSNDTQYDAAWDPVWQSAVQLDPNGWTAELAIPLGQLRYERDALEAWDWQVSRSIARLNETSRWAWSSREDAGVVSRFGYLDGIAGLDAQSKLSVTPYLRGSVRLADEHDDNPFEQSAIWDATMGVDLSAPLGSAFTLGFTANPDFGQVEGDPAQLNLSAFESYLVERRPFFLEGSNHFGFDGPELFYSRRLGRAPRGSVDTAGWSDTPIESPIFFAARLTGSSAGWSVGLLDAVSNEVQARVRDDDGEREVLVEPLANTFVARVQRSLRGGASTIGGMLTSLHRGSLETAALPSQAYALGLDWRHRWDDLRWSLSGYLASSLVLGEADAIERLQRSSARYYQRPDAAHLGVQPDATSLVGAAASLSLQREGGEHWLGGVSADTTSPGFELNDVGFGSRADRINASAWLKYRDLEPSSWTADWYVSSSVWTHWNYGLEHGRSGASLEGYLQFPNFWGVWLGGDGESSGRCFDCTWGGPSLPYPAAGSLWLGGNTDARQDWRVQLNGWLWGQPEAQTWALGLSGNLRYRPASALELSLGPSYSLLEDDWAWVDESDGRGIFAALSQHKLSTSLRLDWTFSTKLSFQGWVQFFVAVGDYDDFILVARPEASSFGQVFDALQQQQRGASGVTLQHPQSGERFELSEPDFNNLALRSTMVLRWEWAAGSTLFVVWQQRRAGGEGAKPFEISRELGGLLGSEARTEQIVMLKLSAWLGG